MPPTIFRKYALLITILAVAGAVIACHRPILRAAARVLIVDQREATFDCVCLLPADGDADEVEGDGACEVAARLRHEVPSRQMMLLDPPPTRTVQVGAVPSFRLLMEKEFRRAGVPSDKVLSQPTATNHEQSKVVALGVWLQDHPGLRVQVLCDRFRSQMWRYRINHQLTPEESRRVSLRALPCRNYDETNWWHSRQGLREMMVGCFSLLYAHLEKSKDALDSPLNPDAYEHRFLLSLEKAKTR